MADIFDAIGKDHKAFIEAQHMFFVATVAPGSRINLSPKGGDCLRVVDSDRVVWLNLTGSGNETAAHLPLHSRMTLMFCSFEKTPLILRVYGKARAIHPRDGDWGQWIERFPSRLGARQMFDLRVESVQSSCGYAVPRYEFLEHRPTLEKWTERKGEEGIHTYWEESNRKSLDGLPTHILPGVE